MPLNAGQRTERARNAANARWHPGATAEELAEIERAKIDAHLAAISTAGRAAGRRGDPPERIEQARQTLAEADLAAHIRRAVDGAPPLSPGRRERLALLLHPGAGDGTA